MDTIEQTTLKIALAGLFHDLGKFAERAEAESGTVPGEPTEGFHPKPGFLEANAGLYQPQRDGRHTHRHALFTAAVIDDLQKCLPHECNASDWGEGDPFINLAAGHHLPQTPLQKVISIADRLASALDRATFDTRQCEETPISDSRRTRLIPVFEQLTLDDTERAGNPERSSFRYRLEPLTTAALFPEDKEKAVPGDDFEARKQYRRLFTEFGYALEKLAHKDSPEIWLEHVDGLLAAFTGAIPAATVKNVLYDISLYDHCRVTAALAAALYRFHQEKGSLAMEALEDRARAGEETEKFLLIEGNFYGIQDFIFSQGGTTGRAAAKLLRGRSFYVSLLAELAADLVLRKLGLPSTSLLLAAAGKFIILAPNTDSAKKAVMAAEQEINAWLLEKFFGKVSIGLAFATGAEKDFQSAAKDAEISPFGRFYARLGAESARRKMSRFDLGKTGGVQESYLEGFGAEAGLCPFCGLRPTTVGVDVSVGGDREPACDICHDQIELGQRLVKEGGLRIAVLTGLDGVLSAPIFGTFQIRFPGTTHLSQEASSGNLRKFWDLSLPRPGMPWTSFTPKYIAGYIPRISAKDQNDIRNLWGGKSERKVQELLDGEVGDPKTFLLIAKKSLGEDPDDQSRRGIEALGVLKADVDSLGELFGCGLPEKRLSITHTTMISRQLNHFFAVRVPYLLESETAFQDIYTVFSGGDDLFLIGPWNRMVEFATRLHKEFTSFVAENPHVTLSAGISVHKPGDPIRSIAESAETALEASKHGPELNQKGNASSAGGCLPARRGRNRLTLFRETVEWKELPTLMSHAETLAGWRRAEVITPAMLYRLNHALALLEKQVRLTDPELGFDLRDAACLTWPAVLKYSIARNVGRQLTGDERRRAIDEVDAVIGWLKAHGTAFRIPLWKTIYEQRRSR